MKIDDYIIHKLIIIQKNINKSSKIHLIECNTITLTIII